MTFFDSIPRKVSSRLNYEGYKTVNRNIKQFSQNGLLDSDKYVKNVSRNQSSTLLKLEAYWRKRERLVIIVLCGVDYSLMSDR